MTGNSARPPNSVEVALGDTLEWSIQRWVAWTGRVVRVVDAPWLEGPVGKEHIGAGFYETYAKEADLEVIAGDPEAGLLPDFGSLAGEGFEPERVHPEIRRFYERTARYGLGVRPEWQAPLRFPARTLIYLVSRNIRQLNLPFDPGTGMTSDLIRLADPATGEAPYAGWLRRSAETGEVVYAGFYTTCEPPNVQGRFVKVVFPLPGGSATVILRPENRPDGAFALVSDGRRFGDAGYYRVHRTGEGTSRTKYVPIKEVIHVFVDRAGTLHTEHTFVFWKLRFLTLHYEITPRSGARLPGAL